MQMSINDSGERRTFSTGAQRDKGIGKGRPSLIVWSLIQELSKILEGGEYKYSAYNWEQGMPLSWYADSAIRHIFKHLMGYRDENHLPMSIFNIMGMIETKRKIDAGMLPKELDDLRPALTNDQVAALEDVAKMTEINIKPKTNSDSK